MEGSSKIHGSDGTIKKEERRVEDDESYVVPDVDHSTRKSSVQHLNADFLSPCNAQPGTQVRIKKLKCVGPFVIAQILGSSPVSSMVQCLARIPNDPKDKFYVIKILTLPDDPSAETKEDVQGKMFVHTEYSLLSMLEGVEGVITCHGLFKDRTHEEVEVYDRLGNRKIVHSGKTKQRISLVLGCLSPHEYCPDSIRYVNLQKFIIQEKQLSEKISMKIFYYIIRVVEELHRRNIVHRDLKLGNMILDRVTNKVTLINFCLGKHLLNVSDLFTDQCGSPAYISPDALSGNPYEGKPSDVWSLGVVLYTMIYGQFPFYDPDPRTLLNKIKHGSFSLPSDVGVSQETQDLISKMLNQNPKTRPTSSQVFATVKEINNYVTRLDLFQNLQVVPDFDSEFKSVAKRLEALKDLRGSPANVRNKTFVTSVSTNSKSAVNSHRPTRPVMGRLRGAVTASQGIPTLISTIRVATTPRILDTQEIEEPRRRMTGNGDELFRTVGSSHQETLQNR